jgi:hypothetical protein
MLSPSLCQPLGYAPAFEMKLLVSEEVSRHLADRLERHLRPDVHGDPALGGAYCTTTLYCDTQRLDVFRGMPGFACRKFRLRRYGTHSPIFLERKSKWGNRVHKRRSSISEGELAALEGQGPDGSWSGAWFRRRLRAYHLTPACQVGYERLAFVSQGLRVTLDRNLRALPVRTWAVSMSEEGLPLLAGTRVLEFKYAGHLPSLCKLLIQEFNLLPRQISKYRMALQAWGHRL